MAIDYDAGKGRRGAYQNLALALQDRLNAQNRREAEDIKQRGLFGSGITQDNLNTLAKTGMDIAKFGDERRTEQMNRAREGMERRRKDKFALYERLSTSKNPEMQAAATQLLMDLNKESDRFEDAMDAYSKKGLWETGFGSESVGYTGAEEGQTQESLIARAMKNFGGGQKATSGMPEMDAKVLAEKRRQRSGEGDDNSPLIPASFAGDWARFRDNPGEMDDDFDEGMMGGVTTPAFNRYDKAEFRLSPRQGARLSRPTETQAVSMNPYAMDTSVAKPQQQTGLMDYRDYGPR